METAFLAEFFVSQLRKSNRKIAHFCMAHTKNYSGQHFLLNLSGYTSEGEQIKRRYMLEKMQFRNGLKWDQRVRSYTAGIQSSIW